MFQLERSRLFLDYLTTIIYIVYVAWEGIFLNDELKRM